MERVGVAGPRGFTAVSLGCAGADVAEVGRAGWTPVHGAALNNAASVIPILACKGEWVPRASCVGQTGVV